MATLRSLQGLAVLGFALAAGGFAAEVRAAEQALPVGPDGVVEFMMPSGNVACIFIPAGGTSVYSPMEGGPELQCTRVEPDYVVALLGPRKAAVRIENPGEQGCCSIVPVLAYGNHWRRQGMECRSEKSGLTCTSATGHGMSLARKAVKVW